MTTQPNSSEQTLQGNPAILIACDSHPEIPAYCSSGMPSHWYYAMRMKYANDDLGWQYLTHELMIVGARMAYRGQWRNFKGKLRAMAELSLNEMRHPERFRPDSAWQIRCGWMGCHDSEWYRTWRGRYEQIYRELEEWPNRAFRYMQVSPERIAGYRERFKSRLTNHR